MTSRLLTGVALCLILLGTYEPFYFRVLTIDREQLRASLEELPYRKVPGLRALLRATAEATDTGDSVALIAPLAWEEGYDYIYVRLPYHLPGRKVISIREPDDSIHLDRVEEADYVLYWGVRPPDSMTVLWTRHGGTLVKVPK